jgi:hypothetical protein
MPNYPPLTVIHNVYLLAMPRDTETGALKLLSDTQSGPVERQFTQIALPLTSKVTSIKFLYQVL